MGTTAEKLAKLAETKEAIRIAINDKGVEVSTSEPFSAYPAKIAEIEDSGIPKVKITIQSNLSDVYFDVSYMNAAIQQETVEGLGVGTYEFPIVTSYPVTVTAVTSVSGYAPPNRKSKSVIYDSVFQMDYLVPGVYLQSNDLGLYTAAEWDSAGLTHGDGFAVVIVEEERSVCISPYYIENSSYRWSTENAFIDGVVSSTDDSVIAYDYDGLENTRKVIAQLGEDNAPAFKQCRSYKTPQGLSAYFPAAGEMRVYWDQTKSNYARYLEIKDLFSKLGVSFVMVPPYSTDFEYNFISSTQRAAEFANYLYLIYVLGSTNAILYGGISKTSNWVSTYITPFFPFVTQSDCKKITINTNVESATFTISYTTIYGDDVTLSDKSAGEYYLPIDLSQPVTVTPVQVEGFDFMPSNTQYVYDSDVFNFIYTLPGVFIRHVNGAEYTTEEWTAGGYANSEADCVVVRSYKASFGIALTLGPTCAWGLSAVLISDICTTTDSSEALLDLDGWGNTQKIISQMGVGNAPAAEYAASFSTQSGLQGYLPAYGEVGIVVDNFDRINDAFVACGGHEGDGLMVSTRIWTSTQNNASYAWRQFFDTNSTIGTKTSAKYYAVPFIKLAN